MDAVFTGATVAFLLLTWAMAHGCEKLGDSSTNMTGTQGERQ